MINAELLRMNVVGDERGWDEALIPLDTLECGSYHPEMCRPTGRYLNPELLPSAPPPKGLFFGGY